MIDAKNNGPDGVRQAPKRRAPRRRQRGLTLLEILVVVTILALVAGVAGQAVFNALAGAQEDTAKVQIKNLEDALETYRVKFHKYPSTSEGLQALVKPPKGRAIMESIPKDPWDQEYIYISPGQHRTGRFDLSSKGADTTAGTEDDITNWKQDSA